MAVQTQRTLSAVGQMTNLAKRCHKQLSQRFDAERFDQDVSYYDGVALALIVVAEHGKWMTSSDDIREVASEDCSCFQAHRAENWGRSIIPPPVRADQSALSGAGQLWHPQTGRQLLWNRPDRCKYQRMASPRSPPACPEQIGNSCQEFPDAHHIGQEMANEYGNLVSRQ